MTYLWYWPDADPGSWDFDEWRRRYGQRPVVSEQSGNPEPLPLLDDATTPGDWHDTLAPHWRSVSRELLGTLTDEVPASADGTPVGPLLRTDTYAMQRYIYPLTDDEPGFGWLLTPHEPRIPDAAVLALHPTAPNGKDQIVGLDETLTPTNGGSYARELAEQGLTVFAPDAIGFGERQSAHRNAKYKTAWDFFDAHPDGSVMGKMAYDTSRALDTLETLGFRRFGSIGHSHGAYGTLFAMLADDRIDCGIMSCGLNLLRDDPSPERWWRRTALIPRLGLDNEDATGTPVDFHHWLALVAPRPVLVTGGSEDRVFPNCAPLPQRLEDTRRVYELLGAEEDFVVDIAPDGHRFRPEARQLGAAMLFRALA